MPTLAFSQYARTKILHAVGRGVSFTAPPVLYGALFKADPTVLGTGDEVDAGLGYGRIPIVFGDDPGTGIIANTALLLWGDSTAAWGVVSHLGLFDDVDIGEGNLWMFGALAHTSTIDDQYGAVIVQIGALTLRLY